MFKKWINSESAFPNHIFSCSELGDQTSWWTFWNFNQENFIDRTRWICFGLAVSISTHWKFTADFFLDLLKVEVFDEDVDIAFDLDMLRLRLTHIQIVIKSKITIILVLTHHWVLYLLYVSFSYSSFSSEHFLISLHLIWSILVLIQFSILKYEVLESFLLHFHSSFQHLP